MLAACVGAGSAATADPARIKDYCSKIAERAQRCAPEPAKATPYDTARCEREATCLAPALRAVVITAYYDCLSGRACGVSDDGCVTTAAQNNPATQTGNDFGTKCRDKYAACKAAKDKTFDDDNCFIGALISDEVATNLTRCMEKSCAESKTCVELELDRYECK